MKVTLVFQDWHAKDGGSVYMTEKGIELSMHDFHSGTVFSGCIDLDTQQEDELRTAISEGYEPVFRLTTVAPDVCESCENHMSCPGYTLVPDDWGCPIYAGEPVRSRSKLFSVAKEGVYD
jgi:hypothetical protein